MRYDDKDRESSNVEDRRGQGGGRGFQFPFPRGGGGGDGRQIRIPIGRGGGGFSITTILIIGAIMLMLGMNPLDLLRSGGSGFPEMNMPPMPRGETDGRTASRNPFELPGLPGGPASNPAAGQTDELATFTRRVLADTEDVWASIFKSFGRQYKEPRLVMFSGATQTACGPGQSAMGPFYCPLDQKIYIDLAFYEELRRRFRAPGDFAQAYVIAHEVGHHVQTILGIAEKVQHYKQRYPQQANQIQVRMELQADCFAGVWANLNHQLNKRLEPGDIEEGLNAANAIGDDMIQKKMQGHVVPDSFTHGSSAQRVRWFKTGFESGRMDSCETFNTPNP